jgi:hypothetical protein
MTDEQLSEIRKRQDYRKWSLMEDFPVRDIATGMPTRAILQESAEDIDLLIEEIDRLRQAEFDRRDERMDQNLCGD